jgi:Na+/H+ antiporter NhaA
VATTSTSGSSAGRARLTQLAAPVRRYLETETGGAGLMLAATVFALLWANSPWPDSYERFWHTEIAVTLDTHTLALDLRHWVNDGLMVFFFFVVGLEVKRELVMGDLTDRRQAATPLVAAALGMAVPALLYLAVNPSGEAASAWGVVVSTDTAFLLGVLAIVGPRCPTQLRIFLLTLAVADDIGALSIIAIAYTDHLDLAALGLAGVGFLVMYGLKWLEVWRGPGYFVLAVGVWVAMYESGVHPTLAGVIIALFTPTYAARRSEVEEAERLTRAFRQSPNPEYARAARLGIERSVSPNERMATLYHPWSSYVIVPIFAVANAGVHFSGDVISDAASSPVTLGIILALVLGKLVGIWLGANLAVRTGIGDFAPTIGQFGLAGGAALSGIGFTIALFIVDLAFDDPGMADQARIGILSASVLAAFLGWALLRVASVRQARMPQRPTLLYPPVNPDKDHIRGPVDAPLTLVEYGDFECPFCSTATGSVHELTDRLGDQLRYVFRHLPLDMHPHASLAAEASEAAHAQGKFWEMYDHLYAHQDELSERDLIVHAFTLGLDVEQFTRELVESKYTTKVRKHVDSAEASGVGGTPTFFVNGVRHVGPFDAETLAARLLESAPAQT